jgi:hypothetical protein
MPTPIHPFQLAKKFGLTSDPRLPIVNNGEEFDFQMKQFYFFGLQGWTVDGLKGVRV